MLASAASIAAHDRLGQMQSSAENGVLEGVAREHLAAGRGHQHLLLELDAFGAAFLADIALEADGHARLEHAVVGARFGVLGIVDRRVLVADADAVRDGGVAIGAVALRQPARLLRELAEADPRADQLEITGDLLAGEAVKVFLRGAGAAIAAGQVREMSTQ